MGGTDALSQLKGSGVNNVPGEEQLIDNLMDDLANKAQGADVGSLVSGAMSVSGYLRAAGNSTVDLFALVN